MKRVRSTIVEFTAIGAVILAMAGCSHSSQSTASPTAAGTPPASTGKPSAAGIQSDIAKVNADKSLSDAQKQIMINQMNHAQAMQAKPGTP